MAKFVRTSSPGGSTLYWINVDQVNCVQQGKNDKNKCIVKFSDDRTVTIEMSAEDFTRAMAG